MRTILITAYAADPYKGSEDGTGWNTAVAIARSERVVLVTRKNNVPQIERYLQEHPDPVHKNMRIVGHDLSERAMRWKKRTGERGYVVYFYLWQLTLPFMIRRRRIHFNIAHSLNFHSDSTPQFLWLLGKPTVWGPVGHHPPVPAQFVRKTYGFKTLAKDRIYNALKWSLRNLDPLYRLSVHFTDHILTINSSVGPAMRAPDEKITLLPAVAAINVATTEQANGFRVVSVGRFVFMKGFDLTIRAFAEFVNALPDNERHLAVLTLVGKGEEQRMLIDLVNELGITDRVEWVSWVDRKEMDAIYRSSHALLFPSHEGAGMVVPEAMAYGLPVICLDNVGPGELVGPLGLRVPNTDAASVTKAMAKHLRELHDDVEYRERIGKQMRERQRSGFTWEHKARTIIERYDRITKVAQLQPVLRAA